MSQQCCSYIRLDASETSQYEVVVFETKDDIKCLDVRLWLVGKRVVDFLLVLVELFLPAFTVEAL